MKIGNLIGIGATVKVYQWTNDTIIKIFNDSESNETIEQEVNNARALRSCSFRFPQFIQEFQYEGKHAIIYEKC